MLNAQQIIDLVNDMCQEPTDNTGRWTDTQLLVKLNNAQDEIALKISDLLRTTSTAITPVAGTQAYTLPTAVGKVYQVWINGQPIDSRGSDSLAKDFSYSAELSTGGIPSVYYIQNNQLNLIPIPNSSVTSITVTGELLLTALTDSSSSYPFENVPYLQKAQKVIALLTAADCMLIDGDQAQYQLYRGEGQALLDELEADWEMYRTPETHSVVGEKIMEDSLNNEYGHFSTGSTY